MIRILRVFWGGYTPNFEKLASMKYRKINIHRQVITVSSQNHGFGRILGTVKKLGNAYSPVPVCVFKRDTRELIWETKSNSDGSYNFRNIKKGLECFIVAFDPAGEYNAVISDKVIAK
ncbi:carboxypeptidase regulatory-like domain-containing protein [Acinetobacter sp. WCHAc010034]|uniref:carboxypeptidase regulatory-like domain-containing protein n=1 Tax=Acinetobacter sp. WCHAc010034 TaxID=1879049 RepID=UPI001D17DF06|nr:carboxypeptidase regulatory-like domain-containing protein [Acinetobacter sp. WCHAc010034]